MNNVRTCPQCGRTYGDDDRFCTVDGAALISSGGGNLVGTVVADRFLVQQKLGEGGMGEVYLAEHVRMKRKVALKLMRPWMLGDPVAVGRFHREAENASQISHPNVAQVYDFGETSERIVYLAMEFVDGEPLSRILEREGRLHCVRSAEIIRQTSEALTAAHSMGILHRDLKPDNVMVGKTRSGTDLIKLVDFGIARAMHRGTQQFTSTGLVVGTPDYMSPEQLSGDELDGRSDLYALALMAFRMLTGVGAYPEGSSGEAMIARLTSQPRSLNAVRPEVEWPDSLQLAFNRALAPDPRDRFADTLEFVAELDAAVQEMPLGQDEQAYLLALSQRNPTPARSGTIPTPTLGTQALRADQPSSQASALLTPPAMPRVSTQPLEAVPMVPDSVLEPAVASKPAPAPPMPRPLLEPVAAEAPATEPMPAPMPASDEPVVVPPTAPPSRRLIPIGIAAVAVIAVAVTLFNAGGSGEGVTPSVAAVAPTTPITTDSVPAVVPPAAAPDSAVAASPDSAAAAAADSTLMLTVRRATLALWSSLGRGAAVIVDSSGLALTSSSLVPKDSVVEVFMDPNTRVRATVLAVDNRNGLATLLLPWRRCSRCAVLLPPATEDPAKGDSVVILPGNGRSEGAFTKAAVESYDGKAIAFTSMPRSAFGAPIASRETQRLVSLGGRRLVTPTALRDALVTGKDLAKGKTPSEVVVPIWPDSRVPTAQLADAALDRYKTTSETYRQTDKDLTLLVMTPQLMKYRAALSDNPMTIPADPIRAWQPFSAYVSERRPVVVLNATSKDAAFPTLPTREVRFGRGDVTKIRLFRNDSLLTPIEEGTYKALTSNGSQAIPSSAIAVYAPNEFVANASYRVEISDTRQSPVRMTLRPGVLEAIAADFAWMRSGSR